MRFWGVFSYWVSLIFLVDRLMAEEEEIGTSNRSPPPSLRSSLFSPPPQPAPYRENVAPFRPSIAIVVGVLTTMFTVTFLLLLYAKHCKRGNGGQQTPTTTNTGHGPAAARRNSGIDRSVVESLPIFRFSSLRGQKEGLECSVCLNRFEPNEVLRLLPKCKHAFHVECVDTWLDAHSTCPLCRYRVDPEDVLLVEDIKLGKEDHQRKSGSEGSENRKSEEYTRRISGRHSSAGERVSNLLQILVQRPPGESTQCRRSVDSAMSRKKKETETETVAVTVGCFDRGVRKDGLLLSETAKEAEDRESFLRRYDHRIILSTEGGSQRRWSDLRPSDLLFLQSEMMISNAGRYSLSSKRKEEVEDGSSVINGRCVSEITGLNRFANRTGQVGPRCCS